MTERLPREIPPYAFVMPWRQGGTLRRLPCLIRWMWRFRSPV
jgi:hypothetical protein